MDEPLLTVRGLYKSFGAVEALHDVNLDLPAGQVTSLSGDNGAGKSVLIKCISGIPSPTGGQLHWEGKPVRIRMRTTPRHWGSRPSTRTSPWPTISTSSRTCSWDAERLRHRLLDEDAMERAAAETLAGLKVTTIRSIRQPVGSLSGGQRQSVAVAKAVMWNSKLVIMDEPTAALGVTQTRRCSTSSSACATAAWRC